MNLKPLHYIAVANSLCAITLSNQKTMLEHIIYRLDGALQREFEGLVGDYPLSQPTLKQKFMYACYKLVERPTRKPINPKEIAKFSQNIIMALGHGDLFSAFKSILAYSQKHPILVALYQSFRTSWLAHQQGIQQASVEQLMESPKAHKPEDVADFIWKCREILEWDYTQDKPLQLDPYSELRKIYPTQLEAVRLCLNRKPVINTQSTEIQRRISKAVGTCIGLEAFDSYDSCNFDYEQFFKIIIFLQLRSTQHDETDLCIRELIRSRIITPTTKPNKSPKIKKNYYEEILLLSILSAAHKDYSIVTDFCINPLLNHLDNTHLQAADDKPMNIRKAFERRNKIGNKKSKINPKTSNQQQIGLSEI